MNDDQIKKMSSEVENSVNDPEIEAMWLQEQTESLHVQEQQLKSAFRMAKFIRDDARMEAIHKDVLKVRNAQQYIEKRRNELSKQA